MNAMTLHTLFIVLHASAATLSLGATLLALRVPALAGAQLGLTLLMTAALAGAEIVGFRTYEGPLVIVFPGLLVLAIYMCTRAIGAWRARPGGPDGPAGDPLAYLAALGFNTISFTVGFLAIAAVRMDLGPIAITAAVVVPILLGRLTLVRAVRARS